MTRLPRCRNCSSAFSYREDGETRCLLCGRPAEPALDADTQAMLRRESEGRQRHRQPHVGKVKL